MGYSCHSRLSKMSKHISFWFCSHSRATKVQRVCVYAQTRKNLCCTHIQGMDVDKDSHQNLDLALRYLHVCQHGRLLETISSKITNAGSNHYYKLVLLVKCLAYHNYHHYSNYYLIFKMFSM